MASDAELVSLPSSEHSAVSLPSDGSSSYDEGPCGEGLWDPLHLHDCGIRCGCSEKCHLKFQSDSQTMRLTALQEATREEGAHGENTTTFKFTIHTTPTKTFTTIHNSFSDSPGMGPFLFQLVRAVIMMTPPSSCQRQKIAWQLLGSRICRKAFYTALKIGEARLDR